MATALNREVSGEAAEIDRSAVSWASIFAGATVAIATTLILIALGSGLGFAAASPWPGAGPTVTKFAIGIGVWLIVTQWLSSALGGYITGRLRTRYAGIHSKEILFRDTAHGLLAWAAATAVVGAVALSITSSATGSAASTAASSVDYATDTMLRSSHLGAAPSAEIRGEITRVLARGDDLEASDRTYLAQQVAAQTGLTPREALQRVDMVVTSLRETADKARKTSSALGFFTALRMLLGAFIASAAAGYAGNLRDRHGDIAARL